MKNSYSSAVFLMVLIICSIPAVAAENEDSLAQKLQNPVANLISVPIQNNWDFGIGSANAMRYTANVQPVIPFKLNDDLGSVTKLLMLVLKGRQTQTG